MNPNRLLRRATAAVPNALVPPAAPAMLLPGTEAGGWELCRRLPAAAPGDTSPAATTRQTFPSLEAAAANLEPGDSFVLALPLEYGLVQRMSLPAAEPAELEEMARIQLEKILPYPAEVIGMSAQEISRTETDVILVVESIHQDHLLGLCQPLTARGCWPRRVVFYPYLLAGNLPAEEHTAFLYRTGGKHVLGIRENGRLSFAQALGGQTAEDLATELPAVLLGAELEGVPTNFAHVSFDARLAEWQDTLAAALGVPLVPFDPAGTALLAAAQPDGDLSPAGWQAERQRGERHARLRQRVLLALGVYGGLLLLGFLWLGIRQLQVNHLDSRLATTKPLAEYSRDAGERWHALSPAVEPSQYLVEIMQDVYEALPPHDVIRLTGLDLTTRGLTVKGEAPSSTGAVEYANKLEALSALSSFHLVSDPPTLQGTSGRWQFIVHTGNPNS